MHLLIIEDDPTIAVNLYDYLEDRGHTVDAAGDGVTGLHLAVTGHFDAILLDIALPGMDGLTVCRKLREDAQCDAPILMLTARDTLQDKLLGFEHGADDYLVKPFALSEVEARLLSLNRRHKAQTTARVLQAGDLSFDPHTLALKYAGSNVKLPPKCMRLVEIMLVSPGRVFSRADLEMAVWGDEQPNSDTLRSHMHILRRALVKAGGRDPVETVHGIGYRIKNDTV
jgi:DNA-binding response OmpR family regulator